MTAGALPQVVGAEVQVEAGVRRSIDGHARLDRRRYFNLSYYNSRLNDVCPHTCPTNASAEAMRRSSAEEANYLIDALHMTYGYQIGLRGWPNSSKAIKEDPKRPGYADPKSIQENYRSFNAQVAPPDRPTDPKLLAVSPDSLDLIVVGIHGGDAFPPFMKTVAFKDKPHLVIPSDLDAYADFVVKCLRKAYTDYERPRYYDVFGEPSWDLIDSPHFHPWHRAVAQAIHNSGMKVLVGGPCMCVSSMYGHAYEGEWKYCVRPFIDAVGREMDFLSLHIYDAINDDDPQKQWIETGLQLESVFDLIQNYSYLKLGVVKPFACSEHGATGGIFNHVLPGAVPAQLRGKAWSQATCAWYHNNALNGQVMTFIDRPDVVLKCVPFTMLHTWWDLSCAWALYSRNTFQKDAQFHRTDMFHFYQLWKDVRGDRIVARCNDPDVLTRAFLDGDQVFICLKNLACEPKTVKLSQDAPTKSVSITRYYRKGDAGHLESDVPLKELGTLAMKPEEMAIVAVRCKEPPKTVAAVNETTYYGNRVTVPIKDGKPIDLVIHVPPSDKPARYATLRIGLSRPINTSLEPTVSWNGAKLVVPPAASDSKRRCKYYNDLATDKVIDVPVNLLTETNNLVVRFPDVGGAIGSAVLAVARERTCQK
jgi:hypothetical protein